MNNIWQIIQNDWHKILVVILTLASVWKYVFTYIKPAVKPTKESQPINIILPKEGCVITIKPFSEEDL
jgi:hypothetical protein